MSVLEEADKIINGPRQNDYGSADVSFQMIGKAWESILHAPVSAHQVALCMAALKLVRESYNHKEDNLIDAAGYIGLAEQICNLKK